MLVSKKRGIEAITATCAVMRDLSTVVSAAVAHRIGGS